MQNTEPCSDTEHLNKATSFIFQTPGYCAGTQHNTVFSVSKDTVRQRDKQDAVWATSEHTNGWSSMGRERSYRRCKSRTSACLLQLLAATDFSLCWNQPIPTATWPFENRIEDNMLCSISKTWAKNCLQSGGSGYSIIVEPQLSLGL